MIADVDEDLGYFGPGSATWRVHGEPLTMVGGLRALLLQALHPEAMRLLYARSSFQDDTWDRLRRTAAYVATVSFGTTSEVDAAAARVRDVHRRLGIGHPEQLAWVHACEVDSFLAAARHAGVLLSDGDADRYVSEQVRSGTLVGVPPDLMPRSVAELTSYFQSTRPALCLTPQAREAARYVVAPPIPAPRRWAVPARLGWTLLGAFAVGLLPSWARRLYGLPAAPGIGVATDAGLHAARRAVAALPDEWRHGPHYRAAMARAARLADVAYAGVPAS